jgi:hypothetical protein
MAVRGPVRFEFEPESDSAAFGERPGNTRSSPSEAGSSEGHPDDLTAFHSFTLILRTLKKFPKKTQKEMIGLITEMLLTE